MMKTFDMAKFESPADTVYERACYIHQACKLEMERDEFCRASMLETLHACYYNAIRIDEQMVAIADKAYCAVDVDDNSQTEVYLHKLMSLIKPMAMGAKA